VSSTRPRPRTRPERRSRPPSARYGPSAMPSTRPRDGVRGAPRGVAPGPHLQEHGFDVDEVWRAPTAFSARRGMATWCWRSALSRRAAGIGTPAAQHHRRQLARSGLALGTSRRARLTSRSSDPPKRVEREDLLLERGAFDGAHLAMMVHPWSSERLEATSSRLHFDVHSRVDRPMLAAPGGVNAQSHDIAHVAIGLLRQQLRPQQVHGTTTETGSAANIIPAAVSDGSCAGLSRSKLSSPRAQGEAVLRGGALATGASVTYEELSPVYSHMESDVDLLAAYRQNAEALGRSFAADDGATRARRCDRHANISLASRPSTPHGHRVRRRGQPPAGVHRSLHYPLSGPGGLRRCAGHAWTTVDAATNPRSGPTAGRGDDPRARVLEVRPARAPRSRQPSPRPSTSSRLPAAGVRLEHCVEAATATWLSVGVAPGAHRWLPRLAAYGSGGAPAPLLRPFPVVEHSRPSTRRSRRRAAGRPPTRGTASNVAVP